MRRGKAGKEKDTHAHAPVTNAAGLTFQSLSGASLGPNKKEKNHSKEGTAQSSPAPEVSNTLQIEQSTLFTMSFQGDLKTVTDNAVHNASLYPRDVGLLKPTGKRNHAGLTSGNHIRRRPPSLGPGNHGSDSGHHQIVDAGGSPSTFALGDSTNGISLAGIMPGEAAPVGNAFKTDNNLNASVNILREGREAQKPMSYKRRADPSPAPSRPPRGKNKRPLPAVVNSPPTTTLHPIERRPSAEASFKETDSVTSGSPTRERPFSANLNFNNNTRKTGGKPPSGRRQGSAPAGHAEVSLLAKGNNLARLPNANAFNLSAEQRERDEVLRTYLNLCREVGETPRPDWVRALEEEANSNSNNTSDIPSQPMNKGTIGSGRRPRLGSKDTTSTAAPPKRTKSPATGRTGKSSTGTGIKRGNSVGRMTAANRAQAVSAAKTTTGGGNHGNVVEMVQQYCDAHLNPFRSRMDLIKKRRQNVQKAQEAFISSLEALNSEEEELVAAAAAGDTETHSRSDSVVTPNSRPRRSSKLEPDDQHNSILHNKAKAITSGLQSIQNSSAKLLLALGDCARMSRKPLGTLRLPTSANRRSASMDFATVSNTSSVPSALPNISDTDFSNQGSPSNTPQGFNEFLRTQEAEVATQLEEMRDAVQCAIRKSNIICIEDDRLFSSPLFISDSACPRIEEGGQKSPSTPHDRNGPSKSQLSPRKKEKNAPHTPRTKAKKDKEQLRESKSSVNSTLPPHSARSAVSSFAVLISSPAEKATSNSGAVSLLRITSATPRGEKATPRKKPSSATATPRSSRDGKTAGGKAAATGHVRSASVGAGKSKSSAAAGGGASPSTTGTKRKKDTVNTSSTSVAAPASSGNAPSRILKQPSIKDKKEKESGGERSRASIVGPDDGNGEVALVMQLSSNELLEAKGIWDAIKNKLPLGLSGATAASGTVPPPPKLWKSADGTLVTSGTPKSLRRNSAENQEEGSSSGNGTRTNASIQNTTMPNTNNEDENSDKDEDSVPGTSRPIDLLDTTNISEVNVSGVQNAESPPPRMPGDGETSTNNGEKTQDIKLTDANRKDIDLVVITEEDSVDIRAEKQRNSGDESNASIPSLVTKSMVKRERRLSGSKEDQAVTIIAAYWRRYKAQKEVTYRISDRTYETEEEEEQQLRIVLERRLQEYLRGILIRRRTRKLVQKEKERKEAAMAEKLSNDANRALTTRERFQKSKEQRQRISDAESAPSSPSGAGSLTAGLRAPTVSKPPPIPIPSLSLSENGISTKQIDGYNKDSDSFKLGVIHRMLQAPQALLYTIRMISGNFPIRPPMAYAEPKQKNLGREVSQSVDRAHTPPTDRSTTIDRQQMQKVLDQENALKLRTRRQSQWKRGVYHLTYKSVKPFVWRRCVATEELPPLLTLASSISIPTNAVLASPSSSPSTTSAATLKNSIIVPSTVRYQSYVDPNELRHDEPVVKDFHRPFERWGCAHSLCRRVFTAAAIYAWKLIFSHTPHDDYKQRQLKTEEERHQRLLRVDERNRSILACYCVRTEREWLREASKDLSFVGQIWNPKNSLNPNDANFEQQCKEMYTFVEDFLFQCFPTVNALDEIPSFLVGAGVFTLLGEVFDIKEEIPPTSSVMQALRDNPHVLDLTRSTFVITNHRSRDGKRTDFSSFQHMIIQRYELVRVLSSVSNWMMTLGNNEAAAADVSNNNYNSHEPDKNIIETDDTTMFKPVTVQGSVEAELARTLNGDTLAKTLKENTMQGKILGSGSIFSGSTNLASSKGYTPTADHVGSQLSFPDYGGSSQTTAPAAASSTSPSNGNNNHNNEREAGVPSLVRVLGDLLTSGTSRADRNVNESAYYVKHSRFIKEREKGLYNIFTDGVRNKKSIIIGNKQNTSFNTQQDELSIVYPKKYLTVLAQQITFLLFGLRLNLQICEDLDVVE